MAKSGVPADDDLAARLAAGLSDAVEDAERPRRDATVLRTSDGVTFWFMIRATGLVEATDEAVQRLRTAAAAAGLPMMDGPEAGPGLFEYYVRARHAEYKHYYATFEQQVEPVMPGVGADGALWASPTWGKSELPPVTMPPAEPHGGEEPRSTWGDTWQ